MRFYFCIENLILTAQIYLLIVFESIALNSFSQLRKKREAGSRKNKEMGTGSKKKTNLGKALLKQRAQINPNFKINDDGMVKNAHDTDSDLLYKVNMKSITEENDLDASPGGWSQVAINELKGKGKVISIDLMHMDHLEGATILLGDIQSPEIQQALKLELGSTRKFDVVLSDMAHKFTGAKSVDVPRVHDLVRFALKVAQSDSIGLSQGGWLVAKYLHGEGDQELKNEFKQYFEKTFDFKPKSCRSESTEAYIIGKGFLLE